MLLPINRKSSIGRREFASFFFAPIVPSLIFGVAHPISPDLGGILRATAIMLIAGYGVVLVLGLPLYLWFKRKGWIKWYHAISGGFLAMVFPVAYLGLW